MGQREMPILGEVQKIEFVPQRLIDACKHRHDAIRLCVQWSGLKYTYIADSLRIDRGQFTRIMSGSAHFPDKKDTALMQLCKNYAPLQYSASVMGFDLVVRDQDVRIRELEQKLSELRGVA